ncbi:polyphosphate kinase 1 [Halorubellus sp. PRR65]|uniref:polyphosphate kinase 1 n=1 Tax=Halorubellus sp. PRR65 TaxID=3098148 RepID=UPI002B25CE52|nr:polyphosphate kinase 1 [Halorubellus sp. PRR65]
MSDTDDAATHGNDSTDRDERADDAPEPDADDAPKPDADERRRMPVDEDSDAPADADVASLDAPANDGASASGGARADGDGAAARPSATPAVDPDDVDLDDDALYLNRELSELAFQRRVLHEAVDDRNPLLERAKFLSLFTSNLDEFFMKRIGGLKQQMDAGVTELTPDGRTPREQWRESIETAEALFERQSRCYRESVEPALADAGIHLLDHDDLTDEQSESLREYFEAQVLPTLTPLTFDPAHPFPFISNLSLSMAILTRQSPDANVKFSRVKIPQNRPRLVRVDDKDAGDAHAEFVPLEQVIGANLDLLFPDTEVVDWSTFRVTRNAEVRRNEEVAEDLIDMIEEVLRERRFATVVRLELATGTPDRVRDLLVEHLDVDEREVFVRDPPLDYRDLMRLHGLDRPTLKYDDWTPKPHPRFTRVQEDEDRTIFDEVRDGDVLVHHPYHSFTQTVHGFIHEAAHDPDVLAIKAAIYRTAKDSNVIQSLIEAAQNGKEVAVMVELKARFDEENNLRWVNRLEEEGIHVAYGTPGLKTHTKTTLVVREETDDVRLYSHVGTGNYHSETAKTYEDLGLFTADRDVGQDLVKLFNFFTGHSMHDDYRRLLIAPTNMREQFLDRIRHETEVAREGGAARIVAKMNRLEHPEVIRALYEASMAGVECKLIVRDICRLRPGIEGVSDNVEVHSIVGRFLEHSRVFYFENDDPGFYIGSADWMVRNLDNRVEANAPVEDPRLQRELAHVLELNLEDNRRRWRMHADGSYEQVRPADGEGVRDLHERMMARAEGGLDVWDGPVELFED